MGSRIKSKDANSLKGLRISSITPNNGEALVYNGTEYTPSAVGGDTSILSINGKKDSAGTIAKGLPVYLVGFDADLHTVELADANNASAMPVIGFTAESFNNTDSKPIITYGKLEGVDTTSTVSQLNPNGETWAVNDVLYISTNTGGLTKVRPTGSGSFIQRVAKVLKVDATGGQIFIFNTARTAGLPNLSQDNVWVGDVNGYPQMVNKSTLGGNTIYTADDALTGNRIVDLDDNKLTFDVGTVVSGTNPNIGLRVDGSNIYYGGGLNSSPLLQVDSDLGNVLNVNSGGYLIATSDYSSAIALFQKRGTNLGLSLASNKQAMGVPLIQHKPLLTSGTSQMIQQFVSSTLVDFQMINADGATGDNPNVKHWLRFGDSLSQASFFRTGFSGRGFIVGAQLVLGTEDISLQGETVIKGNDTLSTSTALAIYDGDATPNKLWDFRNNATLIGSDGAKIEDAIIVPTVQETASTASFTIDADNETMGVLTAMAAATTIAAPTGTPVQGQKLMLRFKDDGTSRALTWNAVWRAIGVTLPTATTASKTLYIGAVYNSTDSNWDVIAVKEEA
jgi:hypothetical protein